MRNQIRIILVDDYDEFRLGLNTFLNSFEEFEIVESLNTAEGIVDKINQNSVDILILDINLSDNNLEGIGVSREVGIHTNARVIMLTSMNHYEIIFNASQSGAVAYIVKSDFEKLPDVIRTIYTKESPYIKLNKLEREHILSQLTPSELETFEYIAKGLTQKEIATQKNVTLQAIKIHVYHVLRKLNVKNSKEALNILSKFNIFSKN